MNNPWTVTKLENNLRTILVRGYTLHYRDGNFIISVPGGADETYSEGKTIRACIINHCSPEKSKWRRDHG